MKTQFETRLKTLERILSPKKKRVVILDEFVSGDESLVEVNENKSIIPHGTNVDEFVHEKIKLIRGLHICALYLSRDRHKKPAAYFPELRAN